MLFIVARLGQLSYWQEKKRISNSSKLQHVKRKNCLWGSVCVWCDVLLWAHMLMHTYKEIISLPFLVSFTFSPKPEELEACHHLKLQEKLPIYFSLSDIWIKNNAEILMNETVSSQIKIACNISVWDFEEGISEYRNDFS